MRYLKKFLNDESGATAMEYGLTALLISVVAILFMTNSGEEVNKLYENVEEAVTDVANN